MGHPVFKQCFKNVSINNMKKNMIKRMRVWFLVDYDSIDVDDVSDINIHDTKSYKIWRNWTYLN